jgi:hypothetical protein
MINGFVCTRGRAKANIDGSRNVSGRTDADLFGQVALSRMLVVLDSKRPEISVYSGG